MHLVANQRDYDGATPEIGRVLGLRSKHVTKKVTYDVFLEMLATCLMKEFKNGEHVISITKGSNIHIIEEFKKKHKSSDLTTEEKELDIEVEIKKGEIKIYVKEMKIVNSNFNKTIQFSIRKLHRWYTNIDQGRQ